MDRLTSRKDRTDVRDSDTSDIAPPRIAFDGVYFAYGENAVLRDLSFSIEPGEFIGVIGPNGAGKTTLLRLLTGLQRTARGAVRVGERDVRAIAAPERARLMAVVPQSEAMAFPYTVEAMVLLGRSPYTNFLGYEGEEDFRIARESMAQVGVQQLAARTVTDLSGGEQHRVLIARALAQRTPVLLLDEPSAHLDIHHQVALFDLLARLHSGEGRSILIITHDLNLAAMYCDRILLLADGGAAAFGPPAEVLRVDLIGRHFGVNVSIDPGPRPHVRLLPGG